jgi:plasmid stabilization system protein ParE
VKYRIKISQKALFDLDQAVKWYESKESDLQQRFEKEFKIRMEQIRTHPQMFQEVEPNQRRAVLGSSFPYSIQYAIDEKSKTIEIAGIFHQSKQPEFIQQEIKQEPLQKIQDKKHERILKRLRELEQTRQSNELSQDLDLEI